MKLYSKLILFYLPVILFSSAAVVRSLKHFTHFYNKITNSFNLLGKFFEGNPKDMHQIIYSTISTLPKDTYIYPGHEYAYSNLAFAKSLEPSNATIQKQFITARDCKSSRQPQVPSLLEDEYTYNPFFRVKSPELRRNALLHASTNGWFDLREMRLEIGLPGDRIGDDNEETDVIVLGIVRTMKNQFKAP